MHRLLRQSSQSPQPVRLLQRPLHCSSNWTEATAAIKDGIGQLPRESLPIIDGVKSWSMSIKGNKLPFLKKMVSQYGANNASNGVVIDCDPGTDDSMALVIQVLICYMKNLMAGENIYYIQAITIGVGNNASIEVMKQAAAEAMIRSNAVKLGVWRPESRLVGGAKMNLAKTPASTAGARIHGKYGNSDLDRTPAMLQQINEFVTEYALTPEELTTAKLAVNLPAELVGREDLDAAYYTTWLLMSNPPSTFEYLTLGPMINPGMIGLMEPTALSCFSKIVSMVGSKNIGNIDKMNEAEANALNAAREINLVASLALITMVPLNLTHQFGLETLLSVLPNNELANWLRDIHTDCYIPVLTGKRPLFTKERDGFDVTLNDSVLTFDDDGRQKIPRTILRDGAIENNLPIHDLTTVIVRMCPLLFQYSNECIRVDDQSPAFGGLGRISHDTIKGNVVVVTQCIRNMGEYDTLADDGLQEVTEEEMIPDHAYYKIVRALLEISQI